MSGLKLIREFCHDTEILTEGADLTKRYYVRGITLQSEVCNKNKRIYPKKVLKEAITEYVKLNMKPGESSRAMGELNHPKADVESVNLENISHKFVEIQEDGNNWITKALVLNTPKGQIVQTLLSEGVQIGISSRGLGKVKDSNGVKIIESLQLITLGDLVGDPSAPDAFVQGILESREWVYENGLLVEKDLSEQIDGWKKAIQESSKSEVQSVIVSAFTDYFQKLMLR
jgi:hypothetical protein